MSHATIYFLTVARDFEHAERMVAGYLEGENFFDYSETRAEQSGPLEAKHGDLDALLNGWDWKEAADALLKKAEDYKAKGDLGMCGHTLIRTGELYAQNLNIGAYVFNIDSGDYSIPTDTNGWWAIAVDFHY
jgi:hypothetical protein